MSRFIKGQIPWNKGRGVFKSCACCGSNMWVENNLLKRKKFCSKICFYKGRQLKSLFEKGHSNLVPAEKRGHSIETKMKISIAGKGKHSGEKAWNWIKDRSKVKLDDERGGPLHKQWSRSVKNRDGWKCKMSNGNCSGQVVAHHILPWREYVELRYEVNNGITLCHFHHPRKRNDEMRLSPYFQELVKSI